MPTSSEANDSTYLDRLSPPGFPRFILKIITKQHLRNEIKPPLDYRITVGTPIGTTSVCPALYSTSCKKVLTEWLGR